jgi:hypothetical protein
MVAFANNGLPGCGRAPLRKPQLDRLFAGSFTLFEAIAVRKA